MGAISFEKQLIDVLRDQPLQRASVRKLAEKLNLSIEKIQRVVN